MSCNFSCGMSVLFQRLFLKNQIYHHIFGKIITNQCFKFVYSNKSIEKKVVYFNLKKN